MAWMAIPSRPFRSRGTTQPHSAVEEVTWTAKVIMDTRFGIFEFLHQHQLWVPL